MGVWVSVGLERRNINRTTDVLQKVALFTVRVGHVAGALVVGGVPAVATAILGHPEKRRRIGYVNCVGTTGIVAGGGSVVERHAIRTTKTVGALDWVFAIQATVLSVFRMANIAAMVWVWAGTPDKSVVACHTQTSAVV